MIGFYCERKASLAGVGRQEGMQGPRVRLSVMWMYTMMAKEGY